MGFNRLKMASMMGCAECVSKTKNNQEIANYKCEVCGKIFEINFCRWKNKTLCFNREFGLCESCLNKLEFLVKCKREKYGLRFKNKDTKYKELEQALKFDEHKTIFNYNFKGE